MSMSGERYLLSTNLVHREVGCSCLAIQAKYLHVLDSGTRTVKCASGLTLRSASSRRFYITPRFGSKICGLGKPTFR